MVIRNNYKGHNKHEVRKVIEARHLQGMIDHPSQRGFEELVCNNMIIHCPITSHDVSNTNKNFSPDLADIRGKTVRRIPEWFVTDHVKIPQDLFTKL